MEQIHVWITGLGVWARGFAPGFTKGLILFIIGWFVAILVRRAIIRLGTRLGWESAVAAYLGKTCRIVLVTIFLVAALNKMGFPVNSLLATIGVSGIIIGMGVRAQIANYFAGVMMLAAQPFKKGDLIEFGPPPHYGRVHEVSMMYTALDAPDNVRIVVPNAVIWRNRIHNFSVHGTRAVKIPVTVPYEVHSDWIREIMLDTAVRADDILNEPAPSVSIADLTGGGVKALLTVWFKKVHILNVKNIIAELRTQFEQAGITATVPAADVDIRREE